MKNTVKRIVLSAVIAAAIAASGCRQAEEAAAPERVSGTQVASSVQSTSETSVSLSSSKNTTKSATVKSTSETTSETSSKSKTKKKTTTQTTSTSVSTQSSTTVTTKIASAATTKTTTQTSSETAVQTTAAQSKTSAETSAVHTTSEQSEPNNGITYIDGILVVNKTYSLPADYAPGVNAEAYDAFNEMARCAAGDGITLYIVSGYRSYSYQQQLYNNYVYYRGAEETDRFSARPGHSEHQTGLAFDVNYAGSAFENTPEAKWLEEHCYEYGFIIRYPKDKESITGFKYEPWHIRYLGKDTAAAVHNSGLCLEEYLGITSEYQN